MVKKKLIQNISNPKKKQSKICLSRNVFGYKRKTDQKIFGKKENFGIKSFWVEFFSKKICNPKEFEEQKRLSHEILVKKIIGGRKFYLGVQNMFVVGSFGSFKHLYTI